MLTWYVLKRITFEEHTSQWKFSIKLSFSGHLLYKKVEVINKTQILLLLASRVWITTLTDS
jgi:hypothetical protein